MKRLLLNFILLVIAMNIASLQSCKKEEEEPLLKFVIDDRDDQKYKLTKIGDDYWFAENLNYETTNSFWYNNEKDFGDMYGRLYSWEDALTVCPNGWHLPTDEDWINLEKAIGMDEESLYSIDYGRGSVGNKLKTVGNWPNDDLGTDNYGFSALPAGYFYNPAGEFASKGRETIWWASTGVEQNNPLSRSLFIGAGGIGRFTRSVEHYKYSVRCIRDQ